MYVDHEFWLAIDCESISPLFVDQLRRKNIEGRTIEKTSNEKNASMASAGTDEKMKVSSRYVGNESREQLFRGMFCDGCKSERVENSRQ
jgi:hypothetical protein